MANPSNAIPPKVGFPQAFGNSPYQHASQFPQYAHPATAAQPQPSGVVRANPFQPPPGVTQFPSPPSLPQQSQAVNGLPQESAFPSAPSHSGVNGPSSAFKPYGNPPAPAFPAKLPAFPQPPQRPDQHAPYQVAGAPPPINQRSSLNPTPTPINPINHSSSLNPSPFPAPGIQPSFPPIPPIQSKSYNSTPMHATQSTPMSSFPPNINQVQQSFSQMNMTPVGAMPQPTHPTWGGSYQNDSRMAAAPAYSSDLVDLMGERNILQMGFDDIEYCLPHNMANNQARVDPSVFRCTLTMVPQNEELLKKSRLPFGLTLHPFRDMKNLNIIQTSTIVRCRYCRTYINPYVYLPDSRHWKCNLCNRNNDRGIHIVGWLTRPMLFLRKWDFPKRLGIPPINTPLSFHNMLILQLLPSLSLLAIHRSGVVRANPFQPPPGVTQFPSPPSLPQQSQAVNGLPQESAFPSAPSHSGVNGPSSAFKPYGNPPAPAFPAKLPAFPQPPQRPDQHAPYQVAGAPPPINQRSSLNPTPTPINPINHSSSLNPSPFPAPGIQPSFPPIPPIQSKSYNSTPMHATQSTPMSSFPPNINQVQQSFSQMNMTPVGAMPQPTHPTWGGSYQNDSRMAAAPGYSSDLVDLMGERNILQLGFDDIEYCLPHNMANNQARVDPSVFRCTLTMVPQNEELLKKSRLPFGLTLHPFRDMKLRPPQPAVYVFVLDVSAAAIEAGYLFALSEQLLINLDQLPGDDRTQAEIGGRITVFQATLPNIGPGCLKPREDPNQRAGTDVQNLVPATDFYKTLALECTGHQVALDLFLLNTQYADLATLSEIAKFSTGCVYHFPNYHCLNDVVQVKRFEKIFARYLTRKIGFEAVLRIRCSRGLSLSTFYGNFFVRSTDLLALANVNPDSAIAVQVALEEKLSTSVCFQAALLYTSSKGDRRIRVHTMCLPTTADLAQVYNNFDLKATVSLIAKIGVDRSLTGSPLSDSREAIVNAVVDSLGAYQKTMRQGRAGGLLAPRQGHLRLFPLYALAMLKHTSFCAGRSIKLDDRVAAMLMLRFCPLEQILSEFYPQMYRINEILQFDEGKWPTALPLSFEYISRDGIYLIEAGSALYLYVSSNAGAQLLQDLFGCAYQQIDEHSFRCYDNPFSEKVHAFVRHVTALKFYVGPVIIVKEESPIREVVVRRLVDDRSESTHSYVEFLQHIKREINN
ncbi:hypothetical protein Y032_0587g344 [Ancylostoma ceylanicum]|uniref:Sec23/Sec24 trunk domain protein n=1 Tax=Ancylostoma ceylanicum TaxID=53326 RepID=A0A016WPM4_9BILA|nr:hypothetical protein Y032_0587g344 [Ancylostoma ceylanicum]